MLATGALVASLLAVGTSPVGAATDTADRTAKTSACVGDALGDQMFTDVVDEHAFKDAINCIAYYGITNGTGDGSTYSPNQDVTRAEMAVFIARAAGVAGVDLGDAMGDEFDDLDDVWQEASDAINQLADKGMISSGGDYRPGDAITRAEMAHFLVGFLAKASSNVTIDSSGKIMLGESGSGMEADDYFGDARAALPRANDAEVSAIYELGITKGASGRCRGGRWRGNRWTPTTSPTGPWTVARWPHSSLGLWLTPRRGLQASPPSSRAAMWSSRLVTPTSSRCPTL